MHQPLPKRSTAGFSLIELVITMTIITILAGLVAIRAGGQTEQARITRAMSDLKSMGKGLELLRAHTGVLPSDPTPWGSDPGLVDVAFVPTARRATWQGPYLDRWPTENPWGGIYAYRHANYSGFNFDGTAGNEAWVLIANNGVGTLTPAILQEIDESMDDGVANTGTLQHNNRDRCWYYVGEGARW